MDLNLLAHSCFRIRAREATVITDPPGQVWGSLGALQADIVTISHHHPGHGNASAVAGSPVVVERPGEYEIKDVAIRGITTYHDAEKGERLGKNTVFILELEGLTLCHLGDLGHVPSAAQAEELGNIDVLLVPVGGGSTIDASEATQTVSLLTPRIVVPMHYQDERRSDLEPLDRFLKEMGVSEVVPQQRLTLSKSQLPAETQVVVLERRRG